MSDLNVIVVTGRLTKDMVVKQFPTSGTSYGVFSIANNTGYGDYAKVNFFDCKLIGKRADGLKQYLVKGQMVAVNGQLEADEWTGDDGVKRKSWNLTINDIQLIGGKPKDAVQYELVDGDDLKARVSARTARRGKRQDDDIAF